jgi:hypothetical protein
MNSSSRDEKILENAVDKSSISYSTVVVVAFGSDSVILFVFSILFAWFRTTFNTAIGSFAFLFVSLASRRRNICSL